MKKEYFVVGKKEYTKGELIYTQDLVNGLIILTPDIHKDDRGFFYESYNENKYYEQGIIDHFGQDNHVKSYKNVIRGLHFQSHPGQAKVVRCIVGRVLDVVVDIRPSSSTFGKAFSIELSSENKKILYAPVGFAHGYAVLSDYAECLYKCSAVYNDTESGIAWDDPDLNIDWKVENPIISERDKNNQSFKDFVKKVTNKPSIVNWK